MRKGLLCSPDPPHPNATLTPTRSALPPDCPTLTPEPTSVSARESISDERVSSGRSASAWWYASIAASRFPARWCVKPSALKDEAFFGSRVSADSKQRIAAFHRPSCRGLEGGVVVALVGWWVELVDFGLVG